MSKKLVGYYATPRDWADFLKMYVVVQVHGTTYKGWLNNINDTKRRIGIDDVEENLIWESGAHPHTQWLPMRDTLLCEYAKNP